MNHVKVPALPYSDCWSLLTPALQENMFNWGECAEIDQSLFRWVTRVQVLPPASRQVLLSEADLDTDDEDLLQMRLISGLIPRTHCHREEVYTIYIPSHTSDKDGSVVPWQVILSTRRSFDTADNLQPPSFALCYQSQASRRASV